MASEGLHEPIELLDDEVIDRHRATISLQEELEAMDWYDQRVRAAHDPSLVRILAHNRDDEKEHAGMLLEWLRRSDGHLDAELRRYLFTTEPLAEVADAGDDRDAAPVPTRREGSLAIGSLKTTIV